MNARSAGFGLYRTTAAAPARIVHLGLDAFARSHQAWYAVHDDALRQRMEDFWDEAERSLGVPGQPDLDLPRYQCDLVSRFEDPRIEHQLGPIAAEGSAKVRLRAVPVALSERRAGRSGSAALGTVAAWIAYVRITEDLVDAAAAQLRRPQQGPWTRRCAG